MKNNVLLIVMDQWSGKRLGIAGNKYIQTPTLDQLAKNGTLYTNAYSESPICIPARRSMYTGTSPKTHGDRIFNKTNPMPKNLNTFPECFVNAGYQAFCVGKLHVYPSRDRIGFQEALIAEEGRPHLGIDDYDIFLTENGHAGQQFMHGMSNNSYIHRPWHLDEKLHVTNWTSSEICKIIKRRNPSKPSLWMASFTHPHPPLAPLKSYVDFYRRLPIDEPLSSDWSREGVDIPWALKANRTYWPKLENEVFKEMKIAYYALCTHIDHQIRLIIATLREEKILDNTTILICADHGDMLGDFDLFGKRTFYEGSSKIPFILVGHDGNKKIKVNHLDNRLVCLQDVMPTLLDISGISIPNTCEGITVLGNIKRNYLYGEVLENNSATRMIHDGRFKLIWYPAGNFSQLFDIENDPNELIDLSNNSKYNNLLKSLQKELIKNLYGNDLERGFIKDEELQGFNPGEYKPLQDNSLSAQRGLHYPPPPQGKVSDKLGFPN